MKTAFCWIVRSSVFGLFCLTSIVAAENNPATIQGSVGAITSSTEFHVGNDVVSCGNESVVLLTYGKQTVTLPCESESIRSGMKVTVIGKRDPGNRQQFLATSVTAVMSELTLASSEAGAPSISGSALIEKTPVLTKTSTGWNGTIFADGCKIKLTRYTKIKFAPNQSDRQQCSWLWRL